MTPAERLILETLNREGVLPFDRFMELALYAPEVGYYTKATTQIGRKGDFYTSPSLHSLFAVLLGIQIEEMWVMLGKPNDFAFVEFGGGMGYFAKDMLDYLRQRPPYETINYVIIELNPYLIEAQKGVLKGHHAKTLWVRSISDVGSFRGVIFSNELLDSFPVCLIELKEKKLVELGVCLIDGKVSETTMPCRGEVLKYIEDFCPQMLDSGLYTEGYRTEVNLNIRRWLRECYEMLTEGFIITIDYGYSAAEYYAPERERGTLLCYFKHTVNEEPLINIGEQDITAHVNFTSLKRWGEELGLTTCGFASQGVYLVSLDLEQAIRHLYGENPDPFGIARLKGLLVPQGLGESHKVLVQYKGNEQPNLKGFQLSNRINAL